MHRITTEHKYIVTLDNTLTWAFDTYLGAFEYYRSILGSGKLMIDRVETRALRMKESE